MARASGTTSSFSLYLDAPWATALLARARKLRPKGGKRGRKLRGRLGYVEGVAMLRFPWLEGEQVATGEGSGWISFDLKKLEALLATYPGVVDARFGSTGFALDRFQARLDVIGAMPGLFDPDLDDLAAELHLRETEALIRALSVKTALGEQLRWARSRGPDDQATAQLVELVREGSVVLYVADAGGDAPQRAVVERKQTLGGRVTLLGHDFRGRAVTVDPRWVTDWAL